MSQLTIDNHLNFFAQQLHQSGFTIIGTKTDKPIWFDCYRDGYFFHVTKMHNEFEGYAVSVNNKPSREHGTGTRISDGHDVLDLKKVDYYLKFASEFFNRESFMNKRLKQPVNYKSVDEFCDRNKSGSWIKYVYTPEAKIIENAFFEVGTMTIRSKPENYLLADLEQVDYATDPQTNGQIMAASFEMFRVINYLNTVAKLGPSNLAQLVKGECSKILENLPK